MLGFIGSSLYSQCSNQAVGGEAENLGFDSWQGGGGGGEDTVFTNLVLGQTQQGGYQG
jgi:hypothetical protein